jgi:arylformamidase
MSRIIDLTMPLRAGMRGVEISPKYTMAREGWNASTLSLYSHAGTHMDAQIHFEAGPETIDQHTPERCLGRAWLVNLAGIAPKTMMETYHLGPVAHLLQSGDSLVLRTDWSKQVNQPEIYRDGLPRLSETLASWCVTKKVKLLGVEPPSVADVNNLPEVTRIHKILLGGGVTIVEGLCNLDQLTGPKFFFAALPLKIAGGDGCPCRAFAVDGDLVTEQLIQLLL